MKIFPSSAPLELVAKVMLGPLTRTRQKNRFVDVMKYHFSKLVRAISTVKVTILLAAIIFLENWMIACGVLNTTF